MGIPPTLIHTMPDSKEKWQQQKFKATEISRYILDLKARASPISVLYSGESTPEFN